MAASEINVMEKISEKMNPHADFSSDDDKAFLAKAKGLTGKVVDKLISKIVTNEDEDEDTDKKNVNKKEGLTGNVFGNLISKFTTDEDADKKKKKTRTQEWGYLTSELMDLLNQPNLAGFSVIGKFELLDGKLVPSKEGKKYKIKSDYDTGVKWNDKIKEQLIGFGEKYGKTDDTVDYLILCCEQYPAGDNNFEFATLDSSKDTSGEVNYNQYTKKYEPVPYHLEESRGFKFLNIHNSSGKQDTDAADSIIMLINKTINQDELLKTIIGGDSNCYYAPFGSKKGIKGIKKIREAFKNTHRMYISKYCIAKYRPNNFLLNAQTMTKGGETTFEETMFLMVPINKETDSQKFEVDTNLYVEVTSESPDGILEDSILERDYIVGFNGAIEYVHDTEAEKPAAEKPPPAEGEKEVQQSIQYFEKNLLSDHLPIMMTLKTKQEDKTEKNTLICFSNNLSIQGSRGLKPFNPDVWKEELLHNEKEIVHYLLLKTVVGVLTRIKEGKYEYKDDSSFISIFYTKIYKEMYTKVATLLENIQKKTITEIPTDLTTKINNLTKIMKQLNKTKNFTKIPQIDPPTPSEQKSNTGGGKKKRTKKGSKKKKRTRKGSKRKRTRRNPTGHNAH